MTLWMFVVTAIALIVVTGLLLEYVDGFLGWVLISAALVAVWLIAVLVVVPTTSE